MISLFNKVLNDFTDGDEFISRRLRAKYKRDFNIKIGLYSYGCFDAGRIARNTTIGRYCSFSPTTQVIGANHPVESLTMHPYFYNEKFGFVSEDMIERKEIHIEDDCWLGHGSIILSNTNVIGRGSVIAAGAVVTKPVPRYSIVAGNPANIIGYRFEKETIAQIEDTKWWELDPKSVMELCRGFKLSKK